MWSFISHVDVFNWSDFMRYVCGHSLHIWMSPIGEISSDMYVVIHYARWMSLTGVISSDMYVAIHYTLVRTMDVSNWICHADIYACLWVISFDMYAVIHYTLVRTMDVSNWMISLIIGHSLRICMWFHLICMWSFITHTHDGCL